MYKRWSILFLLVAVFVNFRANAQNPSVRDPSCQLRDKAAAKKAGRPCRKVCLGPGDGRCKGDKTCKCDHECGWSCIRMKNKCRPPKTVHMANIEYATIQRNFSDGPKEVPWPPYDYGDYVQLRCLPGFESRTIVPMMCHGRKDWTDGDDLCIHACQDRNLFAALSVGLSCNKTCITDNDCPKDYECTCDGSCGRSCVDKALDCGPAPAASNAKIEYTGAGITYTAHYICDKGYYLVSGSSSRKCTGSGKYDGNLARCSRVECGDPLPAMKEMSGNIENYVRAPHYFGQSFIFTCPDSYQLLGSRNRTCLEDGRWSGEPTVCNLKDGQRRCPHPGVPINGYLTGRNFKVGKVVEFGCNPSYALIGEEKQECLYFLQWSGDGAPKCIDPRYSDRSSDVLAKLQRSTDKIKSTVLDNQRNVARFIYSGHAGGHEIFFVIDISKSVDAKELNHSITFCIKLVERLKANATGLITYSIMVYASEVRILLDGVLAQYTVEKVIDTLKRIATNRPQDLGGGTATYKALQALEEMLQLSFTNAKDKNNTDVERHIMFVGDGQHTEGSPPEILLKRLVRKRFIHNQPEFYSITSCVECRNKGSGAYKELLGLALDKPQNFIRITSFYSIGKLLDQVTDARIDYRRCGQAGDTSSVKKQAAAKIGKILDGVKAADKVWPWFALVSKQGANIYRTYRNLMGGGSLINNRWVLTAAHLFDTLVGSGDWYDGIMVTFGIHNRPKKDTPLPRYVRVYKAGKIFIPEAYEEWKFDSDVALIRLGQEVVYDRKQGWVPTGSAGWVNYTAHIKPACVPCMNNTCFRTVKAETSDGQKLFTGLETEAERCDKEGDWLLQKNETKKSIFAVIIGFGHIGERAALGKSAATPAASMKQGVVKILDDKECNKSVSFIPWGNTPKVKFTERMSCVVSGRANKSVDSCQGDSGGPVVREIVDPLTKRKCWVQIGIISWGWGCGQYQVVNKNRRQIPGFHTRLSKVMGWVKSTMANNSTI